ncbi:MAG: integration host factor subunit alpha [Nitrospirae bacterium]|nr:integration host factor subunit alpha [Nitrospirota bacterium]
MAHGKANIIEDIADKIGIHKTEARDIVEIILSTIKETLVEGEEVKIPNFGTFHVRRKTVRAGKNPKTGEDVEITPRTVVTFHRCSKLANSISYAEKVDVDTNFRSEPYKKHDWPALWAEYQAGKAQGQTLTDFSKGKGINRSLLSREFQPFRLAEAAIRKT